jgi:hypothetical protein
MFNNNVLKNYCRFELTILKHCVIGVLCGLIRPCGAIRLPV